jgi:hypothetical protein
MMKRYSRDDLRANQDKLFIFGDNNARRGLGGQAKEARGEPNAVGIRTKREPTYNETDFLADAEYPLNVTAILDDFQPVFTALRQGKTVVWPEDGIGTGIAGLPARAPHTLHFIHSVINALKEVYGVEPHQPTERNHP